MRVAILSALILLACAAAFAEAVDPYSPDGVASIYTEGDCFYVLLTDGIVYRYEFNGSENWMYWGNLSAFPLHAIVDYRGRFVKKSDGTYWVIAYAEHPANPTWWEQLDPFPASGVISSENTSFSDLKSLFK